MRSFQRLTVPPACLAPRPPLPLLRVAAVVVVLGVGFLDVMGLGSAAWAQTVTDPTAPPPAPAEATPAQQRAVGDIPLWWWLAPLGGVLALVFAWVFYRGMVDSDEGDEEMKRISGYVREGAMAYLRQQYKIVAIFFVIVAALLFWMGWGLRVQNPIAFLGFLTAGFFSGLCGWLGMNTATRASHRTAAGARKSLNDGLKVAFRSGAVMGLVVVGFALLDISFWFLLLYSNVLPFEFTRGLTLYDITIIMVTFGMGASLQALFARVGGGIYTKAADVGADLVGKVEAGIPEDDARNPATIADNVGDNVGDVAGMGADLYESYYGSILASLALAAATAARLGLEGSDALRLVVVPPALAGLGIIASILSIYIVRTREGASLHSLLKSLHLGVWCSSALIVIGAFVLLQILLGGVQNVSAMGVWISIVTGLLAGLVIARGTEYYTSYDHAPTQRISEQAQTGPATVIIAGVAEGMKSTWIPLLTIVIAILVAFISAGGQQTFLLGVFGVGIAAVGMLSTLGITLATDAYGPIADNAGGNAQMTRQEPIVRERTDMLDSLGNTTAATGKGFAIGSAALTALALLAAYTITIQSSLTRELQYAQGRQAMISTEAQRDAAGRAAYYRHGLFAVSTPESTVIDAGLLLASRHRERIIEALRGGAPLTTEWDAETTSFRAAVADGQLRREFEIVPATSATLPQLLAFYDVTLINPKVLAGLFTGVMLVFVFCALTMNAVGRAAFAMMNECRRQFGIMREGFKRAGMSEQQMADAQQWPYSVEVDGKKYPDYATCVAISTRGAQREMVLPSMLAVAAPVVTGLVLGVAGTIGLLAGALVSGFAVAIFMANAGGAWDNAKKYIEAGNYGGKGSPSHKAGVVGDTVGDPFKDTSGPSLNILIKLMSMVSVVFAGLIVKYAPELGQWIGLG